MPLSLDVSDFIGSILSHVAHGYFDAVAACLFIALARAALIGSLTPAYWSQRRFW